MRMLLGRNQHLPLRQEYHPITNVGLLHNPTPVFVSLLRENFQTTCIYQRNMTDIADKLITDILCDSYDDDDESSGKKKWRLQTFLMAILIR